jgi:hypothetical protein
MPLRNTIFSRFSANATPDQSPCSDHDGHPVRTGLYTACKTFQKRPEHLDGNWFYPQHLVLRGYRVGSSSIPIRLESYCRDWRNLYTRSILVPGTSHL